MRFIGWEAEGVLTELDIEVDLSRFKIGVDVEAGAFLADPGRGGGCMGVCFDFEPREDPDRASVGVWGRRVGTVTELPF